MARPSPKPTLEGTDELRIAEGKRLGQGPNVPRGAVGNTPRTPGRISTHALGERAPWACCSPALFFRHRTFIVAAYHPVAYGSVGIHGRLPPFLAASPRLLIGEEMTVRVEKILRLALVACQRRGRGLNFSA